MKNGGGRFWFVLIGVGILCLLYQVFSTIQIRTSRKVTNGVIVKVTEDYAESDSGGSGPFWEVDYEFQVGNKTYKGNTAYPFSPQEGDPITVFYAGNNPEYNTANSALAETGIRFFVDWILFVGGIVGFIFYVRWYIRNFWMDERHP